MHWTRLRGAVDTARAAVAFAWASVAAIEGDRELSDQGKRRRKAALAAEAIASLQADKSLAGACEAANGMLARWEAKAMEAIKEPADAREIDLHREIRAHVAALDSKTKLDWLNQHAGDPVVFSALLGAPKFLSGLTEGEVALLKGKVEAQLDPQIRDARKQTTAALQDLENGWKNAARMIAEAGGLRQGTGGDWYVPPEAK